MKQKRLQSILNIIFGAILILGGLNASAAEISIPALAAKSGATVEAPIKIDEVDNLAGVKLVLKYDPEILTFKKAVRSEQTAALMHIVNDQKPGILIIVMAGARGIKGKDISILSLFFDVKADPKDSRSVPFEVSECQLMSDALKKVDCTLKLNPLTIHPQ